MSWRKVALQALGLVCLVVFSAAMAFGIDAADSWATRAMRGWEQSREDASEPECR